MSRLCDEYDALKQRDNALTSCYAALFMDGVTFKDYAHYVSLIFNVPGDLSAVDRDKLVKVFEHLRQTPNIDANTTGSSANLRYASTT